MRHLKDIREYIDALGQIGEIGHVGIIHKMWANQGKDTPCALALGVEPFVPFVGGMPLPALVSDVDYVGVYSGEPVEATLAETVDLRVPASVELQQKVLDNWSAHGFQQRNPRL